MKQFSIADQFTDPIAEEKLLASIYANPEVFDEVVDSVPVNAWTYFQKDFRLVAEAIEAEKPLPPIHFEQSPAENPTELADRIADLYLKRLAAIHFETSLEQLHSDIPAGEVLSGIEQGLVEVQNAIRESRMGQMVSVPSLFDEMLSELKKRHEEVKKKGKLAVGLQTEIPKLDRLLGGLQWR
jgi:replicative DNA helicase